MNKTCYFLCALTAGLCLLPTDASAQRRGGGRGNDGGGGRPQATPSPQTQPRVPQPRVEQPRVPQPRVEQPGAAQPRVERPRGEQPRNPQPTVRVPNLNVPGVPGVSGGAAVRGNAGVRADNNVRRAGVDFSSNVNARNQAIYRNNINIGRRSFDIAPRTYRPPYQNYSWHRGYWNNTYGWNPQIGYGRGFGYPAYGGYGIRLGNFSIGTGGYGGFGGYGYGRYPIGWGYGGWGLGNMLYGSGYMSYYNPYWGSGLGGPNYVYNYAQPIYVSTTTATSSDVAAQTLDSARDAFKARDYATALNLVNRAIKENPSDEVLHEFRALTLFAQKDYEGAAATIHSVLAVGPGWDWATMASLYASVDDYTAQLRALESFTKSNPDDAASRFLLGYHYMTTGHPEHAAKEFASVVKLQPKDQVAKDLLNLVDKPKEADLAEAPAPREEAAAPPAKPDESVRPIEASAIVGKWSSTRDDGSKFGLDLRNDNTFSWKFDQGDRHEDFTGTYTTEGSLLLLQKKDGGALVGHVAQAGDGKFTFKLLGTPADDPGLTFMR
jgi:tetratricopeptide (TPR) repeat protein